MQLSFLFTTTVRYNVRITDAAPSHRSSSCSILPSLVNKTLLFENVFLTVLRQKPQKELQIRKRTEMRRAYRIRILLFRMTGQLSAASPAVSCSRGAIGAKAPA